MWNPYGGNPYPWVGDLPSLTQDPGTGLAKWQGQMVAPQPMFPGQFMPQNWQAQPNWQAQQGQQSQQAQPYMPPNTPPCPPGVHPMQWLQWLQMGLQNVGPLLGWNTGVRPYRDGESFGAAQPTRWSDQPLGLGSTSMATLTTTNITVTNAKRGMIKGLRLMSDAGAPSPALVNSITAAGQTLLSGSGSVPAGYFQMVDSFGNLSSPELMPNSPIVINVTNPTGGTIVLTGTFIMRVAE